MRLVYLRSLQESSRRTLEEIAINIEILGTDDDPEIVFDEVTDVHTILREGRRQFCQGVDYFRTG